MSTKTIIDDKYEVNNCRIKPDYGFISYERDVKVGDVRVIDGKLCFAWQVYKEGVFKKPRVLWEKVKHD